MEGTLAGIPRREWRARGRGRRQGGLAAADSDVRSPPGGL